MSDYLARLVQRAQSLAPGDIAGPGAPAPTAATAFDDPFETIGEPEPPLWPATPASPPQRVATTPDRTDADTGSPTPATEPASPPRVDVPPPTPADLPQATLPLPPETPMPPEPTAPPDEVARPTEPPPARAPRPAPPPPLAVADAFMEAMMPGRAPPAPPIAAAPQPLPREAGEAAEESRPRAMPRPEPSMPAERPARRDPPPPSVTARDAPPILEPVEPEPRLSIGRLSVTVERPPPRQEVTVTRIVQAAPARDSRSGRPRPRFGLAQS